MGFNPYNRSLMILHRDSNSPSGSCLGSVKVHSLTLSYILKNIRCVSQASFLSRTLANPCLDREPKVRVATPTYIDFVKFHNRCQQQDTNCKANGKEQQIK